jgi:hypothetical protein
MGQARGGWSEKDASEREFLSISSMYSVFSVFWTLIFTFYTVIRINPGDRPSYPRMAISARTDDGPGISTVNDNEAAGFSGAMAIIDSISGWRSA